MTPFLIIIVIALLAVTGWQISKIFELSKTPDADTSQVANNKDNENQGKLMMGFAVFLYLLMFYCFWTFTNVTLPDAASEHGGKYDNLMLISMLLIMFVQIVTQALLHYFAYKYRGAAGKKALFYADNDKLEFIWTIIPVITLAGLIIYGLFTWTDIMSVNEDEDPIVIELYAQQFSWTARYAGDDNTLGEANVRFIEGMNTLGVDQEDSYANDDKVVRELHLPVNKPVLFKLRSQDVLHSAYFPHFRAQMNVVPGMITQFGFTPTVTTEEMRNNDDIVDKVERINDIRRENGDDSYEFDYFLLCNKICGQAHYNMQMKVVVESEADYEAWLAEQATFEESMSEE
ncbi:cytochrome c oxidase subunit II [Zunongwangia sp. SCSIO 43204]|uniref:Cytochrome c oxidase subunit 2 n=1 Tax=Zunongwangia mangrovi TaxID=1334022 RepID=A0A1I1D4V3_9FLAO|nr:MULTISPECIES: cytochrome c oxidase subunit II [Zunongwangia]UAB84801.1 cytochrome c oxidase subunit II [Zunongwangia sp. SCSIO 43204]SFB69402.1 cytochrome c oxidase subunit 2 [Zunongwangia mangrovi]